MKKLLWLFLGIFFIWWIAFWVSEKDVDLYGQALSDALIKKIEDWSFTKDKVVKLVESGILYYEKDLSKPNAKKDSENNLKVFQIIDKNLTVYLDNQDGTEKETGNVRKQYTFVEVVDWDTIRVTDENGKSIDVRLIWIDYPESSTQRYWYIECYWEEATQKLVKLLMWVETVEIETDETQWMEDKYWRLLWYVFDGNTNINEKMLYYWFAREYTYDKPYKYQKEFKKAESQAKNAWRWLWHDETCGWERKKAEVKTTTTTSSSDYISSSLQDYDTSSNNNYKSSSNNNYNSKSSSSSSSSSSSRSDKCSAHTRHTWPKWWCFYYNWKDKEYDSTKECCK